MDWKELQKRYEEMDQTTYYKDKTSHGRMNNLKSKHKQEVFDGVYNDLQDPTVTWTDVLYKWFGEEAERERANIQRWFQARGWVIPERKTAIDFIDENIDIIMKRLDAGEGLMKLAEEYGYHYGSLHRCIKNLGYNPATRTQADQIRQYIKQGLKAQQIAEKGFNIRNVYEVKRRDKLKQQKKK